MDIGFFYIMGLVNGYRTKLRATFETVEENIAIQNVLFASEKRAARDDIL
jgi:hypothetical protein